MEIKFKNGTHLKKKKLFLTYLSNFLVTREKLQKFLQHISQSHTYTYFARPIDFFCLTNFGKKNTNLSGMACMVSFRYDSWCWFFFAPFWNNQWITKWWAKFKLECLLLIWIYTDAKFIVIYKPLTLNDGGEDSVIYRNRKKHCFLAAATSFLTYLKHLRSYGKKQLSFHDLIRKCIFLEIVD